eukprot:jgi/Botrbrau1/9940/Bobra.0012s0037.1
MWLHKMTFSDARDNNFLHSFDHLGVEWFCTCETLLSLEMVPSHMRCSDAFSKCVQAGMFRQFEFQWAQICCNP